jgi:hypothetical protein
VDRLFASKNSGWFTSERLWPLVDSQLLTASIRRLGIEVMIKSAAQNDGSKQPGGRSRSVHGVLGVP